MNLREKLLKSTDDVKKALKVPFQVRKDKKSLESWIIDREEEVAELELKIEDLKANSNFNVNKILETMDDLKLAERRLKQGQNLIKTMFEENVE